MANRYEEFVDAAAKVLEEARAHHDYERMRALVIVADGYQRLATLEKKAAKVNVAVDSDSILKALEEKELPPACRVLAPGNPFLSCTLPASHPGEHQCGDFKWTPVPDIWNQKPRYLIAEDKVGVYVERAPTEAIRWVMATSPQVITDWMESENLEILADGEAVVSTPHGKVVAKYGDWILKDGSGQFYPCTDEVFRATYEPKEEQS